MSENFFEKFKKYGIWIATVIVIEVLNHYLKLEKFYWKVDIEKSEKGLEKYNIYFFVIYIILMGFYIWKLLSEKKKEKHQDSILYQLIFIGLFGLYVYFNFNQTLSDSTLFINRFFEKENVTRKFEIDIMKNDFVVIKFLNGGYQRIYIDSVKYKNIKPKDSIAVVKSKIGLFKIPYNHEIVEIK